MTCYLLVVVFPRSVTFFENAVKSLVDDLSPSTDKECETVANE